MKRITVFLMVMLLASSTVLAACGKGGSKASASDYEINVNFSASASSDFAKQVVDPWVEYVNEKSDGKIKVNPFYGATLGPLSSGYNDIKSSVYEAGFIIPGLHGDTDMFPITIGDIPFLLQKPELVPKVLGPFIEKYGSDISKDVTYLGVTSTDAYQLFGQKPLKSVADLKGQKVADSVAGRIALLKSLGATPVTMANADLYESLERGITDFSVYTGVGAIGYKFSEVTKWMTEVNLAVSIMPFYINSNYMNSLPDDLKTLMTEDLGPKFNELTTAMYTKQAPINIKAYEEEVKKDGGGVYVPSDEEMVEWKAPIKNQMAEWVKEADKRGYKGQEMMDYYVSLLEAEGVEIPK